MHTPTAAFPAAPKLGIVMLDTRFPRPPGDVGHPASFGVEHLVQQVDGAFPRRVVAGARSLRAAGLAPRFVAAARALEAAGAAAVTTSCGFLVLLQAELQAAVRVPMATSALLWLPALLAREAEVGVLTIDAAALKPEHLSAAGVPPERWAGVRVQGVDPQGAFAQAILGNQDTLDLARAEADVVAAASALRRRAPGLRRLVLECTNMPPYAAAIERAAGFEVHSLLDLPQLRQALRTR